MATKTGVTGKVKMLVELFDDDAANTGYENTVLANAPTAFDVLFQMACGTSDGQINLKWSKRNTVVASATTSLDLAAGLTDEFGHTLTFAVIKLLIIRNRNTASGDILRVGPHATNGWPGFWVDASDRNIIKPSTTAQPGMLILYDPVGIAVTAGTGDILAITEAGGANTITYDIFIAGEGTYT
jgi:hypothetical protein